jgi:UDP-N-acetylmuramate--alanine ligase
MMLPALTRPVVTYGFSEDADYRVLDWQQRGKESQFKVIRPHAQPLDIELSMPGKHNVLNAVAALAVASDEGVSDEAIIQGLTQFAGVGRRFEVHGECSIEGTGFFLVDDYGHHPTEVRATIEAIREGWPDRRLVMVYQPHRYSRTAELFEQFVETLATVDVLLISEVYAAGEAIIPGATGRDLYRALSIAGVEHLYWLESLDDALYLLAECLEEGDVLLTQGAGETAGLAQALKNLYQSKASL